MRTAETTKARRPGVNVAVVGYNVVPAGHHMVHIHKLVRTPIRTQHDCPGLAIKLVGRRATSAIQRQH